MSAPAGSLKIAWIVPCHNEALTIGKVVGDIRSHCPDSAIYVCDNASVDGTAEIAAKAGAIVIHESRRGKGHAVRALLGHADADIYFMIDGDETYPVESWKDLLVPILGRGCEM